MYIFDIKHLILIKTLSLEIILNKTLKTVKLHTKKFTNSFKSLVKIKRKIT